MPKFRKKPVVIEAVQWTGKMADVVAFVGHDLPTYGHPHDGALRIATLEGDHACQLGDWIIRGIKGELYPCKPDIFQATYEAVEAEQLGTSNDDVLSCSGACGRPEKTSTITADFLRSELLKDIHAEALRAYRVDGTGDHFLMRVLDTLGYEDDEEDGSPE